MRAELTPAGSVQPGNQDGTNGPPPETWVLESAVDQLIAEKLVDQAAIVDQQIRLTSRARRNLSLKVERGSLPTLRIKRPEPTVPDTLETVAAEIRFYEFCRQEPAVSAVARFLAPSVAAFEDRPILVVEEIEGARSLWRHYVQDGTRQMPLGACRALGGALGALHETFGHQELVADPRLGDLASGPPEPLGYDRPDPRMLRFVSPANLEISRLLQSDSRSVEAFEEARRSWRDETLIHGDIRSDNVLVLPPSDDHAVEIRLIDWEFLQLGDPAWDIGDVLRDFADLWVFGMSWQPDLDPAARTASAAVSFADLRPVLTAFWQAYRERRELSESASQTMLLRATRYSGVRLAQTAWEYSATSEELSSRELVLLQIATNVLGDPQRARRELWGIDEVL